MRQVAVCFVILAMVLSAAEAQRPDPLFYDPVDYATGDNPQLSCSGDFNEDGHIDLVTVNNNSTVSVLLGIGDGTFSAPVHYAVGVDPRGICTNDFNEDGHTDLAVACNSNCVSVLLGAGNGMFAIAVDYPAHLDPSGICTGDFNEDGHEDLAVSNAPSTFPPPGNGNYSVLLGNGNGTFQAPLVEDSTSPRPYGICADYLNGDGHLDLMTIRYLQDSLTIYTGYGNGYFGMPWSVYVGDGPAALCMDLFNADDDIDLAVANNLARSVSILRGFGNGLFDHVVSYATGDRPFSIVSSDFDEDGNADLAVNNYYDDYITLFFGNGDGTFTETQNDTAGTRPCALCPGDFDEDGHIDLAVANGVDDNLSIFINRIGEQTGTEDNPLTSRPPTLLCNYPNPFNPNTTIRYTMPRKGFVSIAVYDANGRLIRVLLDEEYEPGIYEITWDGRNAKGEAVGSGMYFVRMIVDGRSSIRKAILLR